MSTCDILDTKRKEVGEERGPSAIGVAWATIQYDSMRELSQFFSNLLSRSMVILIILGGNKRKLRNS